MFIHEPGCREDEKAAGRLLPRVSTWNGTTFPGKPHLCSQQGWSLWERRHSFAALKAGKQGRHEKSLNLICCDEIQSWNEILLLLKDPVFWWIFLVPGCPSGLYSSHLHSCKTAPKNQGTAGTQGSSRASSDTENPAQIFLCKREQQLVEQKKRNPCLNERKVTLGGLLSSE